jgi:hypothetical protein
MSHYRTVNHLAYRVTVCGSAALSYAREAASLARDAAGRELSGGPDHYKLLVPEIQAQAARAETAARKAQVAIERCWALASEVACGPVIRVSDGRSMLFAEDGAARSAVQVSYDEADAARAEAHLALDIVRALHDHLTGLARRP